MKRRRARLKRIKRPVAGMVFMTSPEALKIVLAHAESGLPSSRLAGEERRRYIMALATLMDGCSAELAELGFDEILCIRATSPQAVKN